MNDGFLIALAGLFLHDLAVDVWSDIGLFLVGMGVCMMVRSLP